MSYHMRYHVDVANSYRIVVGGETVGSAPQAGATIG